MKYLKRVYALIPCFFVLLIVAGCKRDNPNPIETVEIYAIGEQDDIALTNVLWKNGVRQQLNVSGTIISLIDVAVSGQDVYVLGRVYDASVEKICFWKNGTPTLITTSAAYSYFPQKLFISGEEVYILCQEQSSTTSIVNACYFKSNGEKTDLAAPIGALQVYPSGIYIRNQIVYVSGFFTGTATTGFVPIYWAGDQIQILDRSTGTEGYANDLSLNSGSGIYTIGNINNGSLSRGCYWLNASSPQYFSTSTPDVGSSAKSVFAVNNDMYTGGTEYNDVTDKQYACYWKNQTQHLISLPDGVNSADVRDIYVENNTVFVAGFYHASNGHRVGCYWIDDGSKIEKVDIAPSTTNSEINAIAVRRVM